MNFKKQIEKYRKQKTLDKHTHLPEEQAEIYFGYQWKMKDPKKAGDLEKLIIEFLKFKGFQCSNIKTTGSFIQDKKVVTDVVGFRRTLDNSRYVKGNSTKGVADLVATVYGLKLDVEVKFSKGDKLRDSQKDYKKAVTNAGGFYMVVRTCDDFLAQFNEFLELPQVKLMKEFSINK